MKLDKQAGWAATAPMLDATRTARRRASHEHGRLIDWELGDSKRPDLFLPQWKTLHWDNECNFSLRLVDEDYAAGQVLQRGDVLEWRRGDKLARFYPLDGYEDGGFEVEVEWAKRPASNVVEYSLRSKGLVFWRQPEISPEDGRPLAERVQGSYAVYHASKKHNRPGKHYRAGKAFHIYRPEARDASGRKVWCDLLIEGERLTVTVPQAFVDSAAYPVVVDPTIGYTSQGASATYLDDSARADIYASSQYTASTGDTVTKFSLYGDSAGELTALWAAYTFSGGVPVNRLAAAVSLQLQPAAAWQHSATVSQSLTNGVVYVCAVNASGGVIEVFYDTPGGDARSGDDRAGLNDPWVETAKTTALFSIYATVDGAPAAPVLSVPTVTNVTSTGATVGCTTDTASGTLYVVVQEDSIEAPTGTEVSTGLDGAGGTPAFEDSQTITSIGAKTFTVTGLTAGKTYRPYYVHLPASGPASSVLPGDDPPIYPGTWRPASDITTAGWTKSGGTYYFENLDEDTSSNADSITSPTLSGSHSISRFTWDRSIPAGTYTLKVTHDVTSGSGFLQVFMTNDADTSFGDSGVINVSTVETSTNVTVTTTSATTRVRIEMWV